MSPAIPAGGCGFARAGGSRGQDPIVAGAVSSKWAKGAGGPAGDEAYNLVVADPVSTREGKTWTHEGNGNFRARNLVGELPRRLTPRECERLQGFPDDWTRWAADGSELADSPRYRMIGNAVAVPVAEWIGRRIMGAS